MWIKYRFSQTLTSHVVQVLKIYFYESRITSIKDHAVSHSIHKKKKKTPHERAFTSSNWKREQGNDWRENDFFAEGCEIASLLHSPSLTVECK